MQLSKVQRCQRLPSNVLGRDFVVGDLHGHRPLLEAQLCSLGFDTARDRLLSVGDLVNRGTHSLATLALIEEPWFHAVLGNHELMLLHHLGYYHSRRAARKALAGPGAQWIGEALATQRKLVFRLADHVASLPLALHVEDVVPFNVMHGDLCPLGTGQDALWIGRSICVHRAETATTSRENHAAACRAPPAVMSFEQHEVQISPTPLGAMPITYVGHSPVQRVTVHRSYVYIDLGVAARPGKRPAPPTLAVLDHQRFASWLRGVTAASSRAADAPQPSWHLGERTVGSVRLVWS